MKIFAIVLVCAFAAVQGRSANLSQKSGEGSLSLLGDDPHVVHLRVATSTGQGLLNSCAGSLIDNSWLLTSAGCLSGSTFNWVRYAAPNVFRPQLVTESNTVHRHPTADLALISINRVVETNDYIKPIQIGEAPAAGTGRLCGWGATEDNTAGVLLRCQDVDIVSAAFEITASVASTRFDLGQSLVGSDGTLIGILSSSGSETKFLRPSQYRTWINQVTGLNL